ncbi:MAG: PspC domain-containing protein [Gaiella sp.]
MSTVADERHPRELPALDREHRVIAGVAAGLATALGVGPIVVRGAFVALAAAGGLGLALYVVAWLLMARSRAAAPAEAVEGLGRPRPVVAVCLLTVGGLLLAQGTRFGFDSRVSGPLALVGLGLLVAWHRGRLGGLVGDRRSTVRIAVGLVVAGAGIAGIVALNLDLSTARNATLLTVAVVGGLALVAAPAVAALGRDLAEERRRRIRSEERARIAAHLHDSVLQTLALVQRGSDDPALRTLARRQERELRSWLYGGEDDRRSDTLRATLEAVCVEVEDLHGVPIEVVVVGPDVAAAGPAVEAVAAVREAVVNAAKHAGVERIDVYAEVADGALDVFVRDTGRGFDPHAVPADRVGLRESIVARVERLGGDATVTSALGEGTEVELHVPLETAS